MLSLTISKTTGVVITAPDGAKIIVEYIKKSGSNQTRIGFNAPAEYKINRFKTGEKSGQENKSLRSDRDVSQRIAFRDLCEDI